MTHHEFAVLAVALSIVAVADLGSAATVEVDGVKIKTLSEAVEVAQTADDGPHTINIVADKLPTADGPVIINEPMTINGDADGNGVMCDILADVKSIQEMPGGRGDKEKGYLEVQAVGQVTINDLKIHPNADASDVESEFVDGVRLLAPPRVEDKADYALNRVWVSGSDGNNGDAFVPLNTVEDLYNKPGIKRWSGQDKRLARAVIQVDKEKPKRKPLHQLGSYNSTLTDCHAGLGRGPALNIAPNSGHHIVKGGLFGHSGTEGIRVAGDTVTLTGSPDNRITILRVPNETITGTGGNAVTVVYDAHIALMEYIDAATINEANAFAVEGAARIDKRQHCRATSDLNEIFTGSMPADPTAQASAITPVKWLSPAEAWIKAQADEKPMLLFFHSDGVAQAEDLNSLFQTDKDATECLGKFACSRVDVMEADGDVIAKKYQVFKVPTLLLISPDAKSYSRVTPSPTETWQQIQEQLTAQ